MVAVTHHLEPGALEFEETQEAAMTKNNRVEDFAERLARALPGSLQGLRSEVEHNFRALLQANLERLDLVGRERFDVQAAQLARAQQRLQVLEKRLKVLERTVEASAVSESKKSGTGSAAPQKDPET